MNSVELKLYLKIALVKKNSKHQGPNVLLTIGVKKRDPIIKISLQTKVQENRTLISINLFLEDLEVLSKLILKRNMRRDQQRNTGMKRLHSNKLQNT